jgi:hypothetical protein
MSLTKPPLLSIGSSSSFNMDHPLGVSNDEYFAPEDQYSFTSFAFTIDKATNESIQTAQFTVVDWGTGDFSTAVGGVPTTNQFTSQAAGGPTTVQVESHTLYVSRSTRARALTYSMFGINWVLTLCSIITTSLTFDRERKVKDMIALLPITFILAIPTIRSLYVGSPPFGIRLGAHRNRAAPLQRIDIVF